MLARRPDIRAAEQTLIAANANIGAAKAAYFPTISLTGLLGFESNQLSSLFKGASSAWQFVPRVTQPIFTAGRITSQVHLAEAQQQILAATDRPHVYVQSSVFARGSGANPNGDLTTSADGLGLDRANWAAGVQVVFPNVFDFSSLRARRTAAAATTRAETALYDEALLTVAARRREASALAEATRAAAANTPVQLTAARQSEAQARARFEAGLAPLNELADAQSLLAQAEVQDELARLDVWRALLAEALASGSLDPFLAVVRP